jgi:hypothetical protein
MAFILEIKIEVLGGGLNELQAQLDHTDLKTTSIYLKADINHRLKSYEGFEI